MLIFIYNKIFYINLFFKLNLYKKNNFFKLNHSNKFLLKGKKIFNFILINFNDNFILNFNCLCLNYKLFIFENYKNGYNLSLNSFFKKTLVLKNINYYYNGLYFLNKNFNLKKKIFYEKKIS